MIFDLLSLKIEPFYSLNQLNVKILDALRQFNHKEVIEYEIQVQSIITDNKKISITKKDETQANNFFIISLYFKMLLHYSALWDAMRDKKYQETWFYIQDCNDILRLLKNFEHDYNNYNLIEIEYNLFEIEKLFPFTFFNSAEMICGKSTCSICRRDTSNPECIHIPGELYWGKMAQQEMGDIKFNGIAILRNPKDKRCAITTVDGKEKLSEDNTKGLLLLATKISSPYYKIRIIETKQKEPIFKFKDLKKDDPCPCQSGKKFYQCCSRKKRIGIPHMKIFFDDEFKIGHQ